MFFSRILLSLKTEHCKEQEELESGRSITLKCSGYGVRIEFYVYQLHLGSVQMTLRRPGGLSVHNTV